jgi:hypothetical protein
VVLTLVTVSGDLYRRNPARDVERLAASIISLWVGDQGQVIDMGSTHEPDIRIEYADGRLGLGEVGWYVDQELQAMWGNTFKRPRHQVVELPAGAGKWMVSLTKGASIKALYAGLPALVVQLNAAGLSKFEVYGEWPRGEPADTLRGLGIDYLSQLDRTGDVAYYFMPASGGIVPFEADSIVDWIDSVIVDPNYRDTTQKLLGRNADERHVFLMAGSATPFGVDERLRRLNESVPKRPPAVPEGITHVWCVSQFLPPEGLAALWVSGHGWGMVAVPPLDLGGGEDDP